MSDPLARTRSLMGLYLRHGRPPRDPEGWVDIGPSLRPRPAPADLQALLEGQDWVLAARVRVEGTYPLVVRAVVVPRPGTADIGQRMADAGTLVCRTDWRIGRVVVAVAGALPAGWTGQPSNGSG